MAQFKRGSYASRPSTSAPREATFNAAVRIKSYHLAGPMPDPTKDYAIGVLLQPIGEGATRIDPEFAYYRLDEENKMVLCAAEEASHYEPITEMKVALSEVTGQRQRDLHLSSRGKGLVTVCPPGTDIIFERAFFVKGEPNSIQAPYMAAGPTPQNRGVTGQYANGIDIINHDIVTKQLMSDVLVSIRFEGYEKNADGTRRPYGTQKILVSDTNDGRLVTDEAQLNDQVRNILEATIGNPGFVLIANRILPDTMTHAEKVAFVTDGEFEEGNHNRYSSVIIATTKSNPEDLTGPRLRPTFDEVMAKLWADGDMAAMWARNEARAPGSDPLFQFTIVPMMQIDQAKSSVPSVAAKDVNKKHTDSSIISALYGFEDPANPRHKAREPLTMADGRTVGIMGAGWTKCHLMIRQHEYNKDYWYSDYQSSLGQRAVTVEHHDIKTAQTLPYHSDAIDTFAATLSSQKRDYSKCKAIAKAALKPVPAAAAPGPTP